MATSSPGNNGNGVLLYAAGNDNFVEWDTIAQNRSNGVDIDDSSHTAVTSTIEYNTSNGVYIDNSAYITVGYSTIEYNEGWGILDTSNTNYQFIDNTYAGNGLGSVQV